MRISDWSSDVCSSDLIASDIYDRHQKAFPQSDKLAHGGWYKYRRDVDYHAYNPNMWRALQKLAQTGMEHQDETGEEEIGRASCRERVCPYVKISVVAV